MLSRKKILMSMNYKPSESYFEIKKKTSVKHSIQNVMIASKYNFTQNILIENSNILAVKSILLVCHGISLYYE